MARSFWSGFEGSNRDFPSPASAGLFYDSAQASPEWDDFSRSEKDEMRERYLDDIADGDVRGLRDWLSDMDIDWSMPDLLAWKEDVDTDRWTMSDWDEWRSLYG